MTKKSVFDYKDRDDTAIKKRAEQRGFSSRESFIKNGYNLYKPGIGKTNKIRFLPPTWEDPEHYGFDIWVHYNIGEDKSAYLCNKIMKNEKCPVCEAISQNRSDKEYVSKIKPVKRTLVWLIDREDEEVVKAWAVPAQLDRNFVLQSIDEDTGKVLKIDHPVKGYDVSFETVDTKSTGIPYKYEGERIARNSKPIFVNDEKMDKVLRYIVETPVVDILDFKTYEHIKNVFDGETSSSENEEEEDVPYDVGTKYSNEEKTKETKPESEGKITVKMVNKMDREELEDVAVDELEILTNREVRRMEDEDIKEAIIQFITQSEKEEEEEEKEEEPAKTKETSVTDETRKRLKEIANLKR